MSLGGISFMDHPAVNEALEALSDAIELAAQERGLTFKAVAVVGHTREVTGIATVGCDCDGCRYAMATHLRKAMREGSAPDGNSFSGVH